MSETVDRLFRRMKGDEVSEKDLLQIPLTHLKKPVCIESKILGEQLYLCGDEEQAGEIERAGGVCYLPNEIKTLILKSSGMDEVALKNYLMKIHGAKKTFPGARIQ